MEYFLGIDAGGSRTRAALVSATGKLLGLGFAGAANFQTSSISASAHAIQDAVRQTLAETNISCVQVACIGSAGLEDTGSEAEGRILLGNSVNAEKVLLDTDAYIAWAGALSLQPGIIVIAGTGSICFGVDAQAERYRIGGWGPYFGDEGSAYWIASRAIGEALKVLDKRSNNHEVLTALLDFAGLSTGLSEADLSKNITTWLYGKARSSSELAQFALHIDRLARRGNKSADSLLVKAGQSLASLALAMTHTMNVMPPVVSLGGSVLIDNHRVKDAFMQRLSSENIKLQEPLLPPVMGAVMLALDAEKKLDQAIVETLGSIVAQNLW